MVATMTRITTVHHTNGINTTTVIYPKLCVQFLPHRETNFKLALTKKKIYAKIKKSFFQKNAIGSMRKQNASRLSQGGKMYGKYLED